jgi:hypothetical protein
MLRSRLILRSRAIALIAAILGIVLALPGTATAGTRGSGQGRMMQKR